MNYPAASCEESKDDPPVTFGDIPLAKGDKIEKLFYRQWYRFPPLIRGDVRRTGGILPHSKLRGILRLKYKECRGLRSENDGSSANTVHLKKFEPRKSRKTRNLLFIFLNKIIFRAFRVVRG